MLSPEITQTYTLDDWLCLIENEALKNESQIYTAGRVQVTTSQEVYDAMVVSLPGGSRVQEHFLKIRLMHLFDCPECDIRVDRVASTDDLFKIVIYKH